MPAPEASTPTRNWRRASLTRRTPRARHARPRASETAAGRAQQPGGDEVVDAREHLARAELVERAVLGQAVVAVLQQRLRAPAAQDLDRPRAPDRRRRRHDDRHDRGVEVLAAAAAGALASTRFRRPRAGAGAAGTHPRSQTSQHGTPASGAPGRRSPKWRRIVARRQAEPSANAHTARYWRQRARRRWRCSGVGIAGSERSSRWMKNACSPLSRFSANSSARAGRPSRPARPASW